MSLKIDLPFPPSVNRIWRGAGKHVYRSPAYKAWLDNAWGHWLEQRSAQAIKSVNGYYTLKIILNAPDKRLRDLGNFEKPISDFLEQVGIIQNDCLCRELHIVWGDSESAPYGLRVILAPID